MGFPTRRNCGKKAVLTFSATKVIPTVFLDACGILQVKYLKKGQVINGEYFDILSYNFNKAVKERIMHYAKEK